MDTLTATTTVMTIVLSRRIKTNCNHLTISAMPAATMTSMTTVAVNEDNGYHDDIGNYAVDFV